MPPTPITGLLKRLRPLVRNLKCRGFNLHDDLQELDSICHPEAPVGTVLYCTRILEALAMIGLQEARIEPDRDAAPNLDTLFATGLLPLANHYWAHALRRIGNDARHFRRPIRVHHVDTALVFVDRCLHWFFHRPASTAAARLTLDDQPLWNCDAELYALAVELEQVSFNSDTLVAQLGPGKKQAIWLRSPALPAALAEQLLEQRRNADARKVLDVAQSRFQHDLRLRQLEGLCLSREGRLDEAQAVLEELNDDREWCARPAEDFETCGILAGVYKRQWDRTGNRDWLEKANATYEDGWQDSHEKNTYLGINAAATALWLGETARVAPCAAKVRSVLLKRERAMGVLGGPPRFVLSFWDQVTLAEALLLLGHKPEARACYLEAFLRNPEKEGNINGARAQAIKDLRAQGETKEQAESFFN